MYSQITIVNAFLLMVFTGLLIVARFKIGSGSNWPFVYYALLVSFHQAIPGLFSPLPLYFAVVSALFLRFEYMSKSFSGMFRFCEMLSLGYVATALLGFIDFRFY